MEASEKSEGLPLRGYKTIFDNVSDGLIVHPPDSGDILYANERFAEMLGYTREEILDLSIPDVTAEDWEKPVSAAERVQQARERGQVKFEWVDRRKDGSTLPVEVNLTLVELEGKERVLASVRDIAERKRHERRAKAVFDQTYQFTGLMEPDGTLIEANRTALEFGGLTREDVVGKPLWECYWWQTDPEARRDLRAAIERAADGEFVRYDVEVRGAQGTEVIDFSIRPVTDGGEVTLLIPEGRVVTDLQERRQRLDVYNRVMRHNIRNKLSVVNACVAQLRAETGDRLAHQYLDTIDDATDRLEGLAREIRAFDEVKQQETTFERVDLGDVLADVAAAVEADYEDATVHRQGEAVALRTSERYCRIAVEELLENALEHGGSEAWVSAGYADDGDAVTVEVRDEGPGLSDEEITPVLSGAETPLNHGSGIGLWLVKWSVDELGGTLRFDSHGDGTTARVRLPVNP